MEKDSVVEAEQRVENHASAASSSSSAEADSEPTVVFQSRLQAKRLERMQQQQQSQLNEERRDSTEAPSQDVITHEQQSTEESIGRPQNQGKHSALINTMTVRPHSSHSFQHHFQHEHQQQQQDLHSETIATETSELDAHRLMLRGEARRAVMRFGGSVWDAVKTHDLEILRCFFVVEGAQRLLSRRSPEPSDGGRSLLHCAAWLGDELIVRFLLDAGAQVDAVDTLASKTTSLLEAARAGHKEICVLLLQHEAEALHRDSHGDTAFHWAARCGHGTLLLEMAMEIEKLEGRRALTEIWAAKNLKGKTVLEYAKIHSFVLPLIQKRLGVTFPANGASFEKRKSRFPLKTATIGVSTRGLLSNASARSMKLSTSATVAEANEELFTDSTQRGFAGSSRQLTPLAGVEALGLDVASFAYKSRDELASR